MVLTKYHFGWRLDEHPMLPPMCWPTEYHVIPLGAIVQVQVEVGILPPINRLKIYWNNETGKTEEFQASARVYYWVLAFERLGVPMKGAERTRLNRHWKLTTLTSLLWFMSMALSFTVIAVVVGITFPIPRFAVFCLAFVITSMLSHIPNWWSLWKDGEPMRHVDPLPPKNDSELGHRLTEQAPTAPSGHGDGA
jgi:hypothetical protein